MVSEDDADADILRLAQTQGLIPDHSLRTPRRQLVPRTVRQREIQLDENPLAEPTTSESSYASAVRRSPLPPPSPPPPPNQTNHNGSPYHNDRRPRDVNGHGRADGRAGGPGADNRARNAQNGRGNNNNNGIITGNGEYFDLRAAQQTQRKKKQRVGLFLSRVRPDFRCRDVVSHVRQVTGLAVRCEPIPTRYGTFRSYCIQGRSQDLAGGGARIIFFEIWKFACREAPREFFFKWCNLVRFRVYLDQILSLIIFKNYHFLYKISKIIIFYIIFFNNN